MSAEESPPAWLRGEGSRFATTRWSLVVSAGGESTARSRRALEELCGGYWYPLYVFARRRGLSADEAPDLVQGFFAYLLEKGTLAEAEEQRGRFRTFLLTVFERYLLRHRERAAAKKRGGGRTLLSFDAASAEERYRREPAHHLTPQRLFERRFALLLLEGVLSRLEQLYAEKGRSELFERLKATLTADADALPYRQIAEELGMSEPAVKVAAHRLRCQFRELLREEIGQTLSSPEEIDDELHQLRAALGD